MLLPIVKSKTKTTAALLLVLALVVAAPALAQQGGSCKIGTGPVAPASGAVLSPNDPLTLRIDVSATPNTPDCQHNATGWQVATDAGFALDALVFDSGAHAFDLRSITIQPPLLQPGTIYWWRARVQVTNAGIIEWIEIKDTFSTPSPGGAGGGGPVIWSLAPALGVPGTTVSVGGSGFVIAFDPVFGFWQSEVLFDGQAVPTSFIGNFELAFTVPAGAACGPHDVQVRNPDPSVFIPAVSHTETFEIPCAQPPPGGNVPAPQISSLDPPSAAPGEAVRVLGSGFLEFLLGEVSTVRLEGSPVQTTFVSASELRFTLPPLIPCGPNRVQVVTTLIGESTLSSNVVNLDVPCGGGSITPPTPAITRLNPASGPAGTQVSVVGSDFVEGSAQLVVVPGSEVLFDGTAVSTQFVSATELGFAAPAGAACGPHDVRVRTESPVLNEPAQLSNAVAFEVTCPAPGNPPPGGGGNQPPTAGFNFSPGAPQVGQTVSFSNQSTDPDGAADIASVRWSFGDGAASAQANASHAYAAAGSYTVTLTVTDQAGLSDQIAKQIQVSSAGSGAATRSVAQAIAALVPNDPNAANADLIIGDREILRAVAMWVKGELVPDTGGARIGDGAMIDLIKRWIGGLPLSAAGAPVSEASARAALATLAGGLTGPEPLQLHAALVEPQAAGRWTLRLAGSGIARHEVRVYDMTGRLLHAASERGDRSALIALDRNGNRLPNGIYLVTVTALDASGAQQRRTVVKWAVLR